MHEGCLLLAFESAVAPQCFMSATYIGRFAPSPTGALHFGSLIAALVSYLDARAQGGQWLVRMEDLDPPREMAGAADLILKQLENHGLFWDSQVVFQSQRHQYYKDILDSLVEKEIAYYCNCSRQAIRDMGGIYDGRCYSRTQRSSRSAAVRLHIPEGTCIQFTDLFQGFQQQRLDTDVGDFVVRRKDGFFAYQLAVVVDDCAQGVNHVLRGMDLLDSTARQIWLMGVLGCRPPIYGHIPLALNRKGQKLSKQNHAPSLDSHSVSANLHRALSWLGITLDAEIHDPNDILTIATKQWRRGLLLGRQAETAPTVHSA